MSESFDWKINNPYFIDKITVKGLLSRYDIEWELDDVNVLVGRNGTGKSTIFKLAQLALSDAEDEDNSDMRKRTMRSVANKFESIEIVLNNKMSCSYAINDTLEEKDSILEAINFFMNKSISDNKLEHDERFHALKSLESYLTNIEDKPNIKPYLLTGASDFHDEDGNNLFKKNVSVDFISTFDMLLLSQEKYDEANKKFYSQLDSMMRDEVTNLKSNLLTLSNQASEKFNVIEKANSSQKHSVLRNNIFSRVNIFKKVINGLFKEEHKIFDISSDGNMVVKYRDVPIKISELSSGEKQLLIIMLKVLNSSLFNPSIIFMDEPEISLHVNWQNQLISSIKRIAPNSQLIIVSHSPAMVMTNWLSSLTDIKEITIDK